MASTRRSFSSSVCLNMSITSTKVFTGLPIVQSLQKYFGGTQSCFPIINDQTIYKKSHISSVFVFSPINSNKYKWCYNVKGMDGGQYIANFNPIDGVIYALHQTICDGILIGARNVVMAPDFNFMPYFSSTFDHITPLEPNLSDILVDENKLLKEKGFIDRDFPAVIITTQSGKEIINNNGKLMDILDCNVFTHINPFTNNYNDVYIITSINGAEEIKKRWNKNHLMDRDKSIDDILIILSDNDKPDTIKTELIADTLYKQPYNLKYITCEGGVFLMQQLLEYGLTQQLNFSFMRECITNRTDRLQYNDKDIFQCIEIKWNPVISFNYHDHDCCFVVFDPN